MKIEAGKSYRTRSGQVVDDIYFHQGEWTSGKLVDGYIPMWDTEGRACFFFWEPDAPEYDLVEEVV